jgi:hypothetical protein
MSELDANIFYEDSELQSYSHPVLCIEDHDSKSDPLSIDTRLFICWNNDNQEYFLTGRRQDTQLTNYVPYIFNSYKVDAVYDFIEFVLGKKGKKSVTLYNFNNIYNFNDLNYEFFEQYMDKNYEIAGYDNLKLNKKHIKTQLGLLKNIYNWFN